MSTVFKYLGIFHFSGLLIVVTVTWPTVLLHVVHFVKCLYMRDFSKIGSVPVS